VEGVQAVADSDAVAGAYVGGELGLKALDLLAEYIRAAAYHAVRRSQEIPLQLLGCSLDVEKRNDFRSHRSAPSHWVKTKQITVRSA
jgi:hypothetical protein